MKSNYKKKYFLFQEEIGKHAAEIFSTFYNSKIKYDSTVVDFGCGGGFLLEKINCKNKIGIEINPFLIKRLEGKFKIYQSLNHIRDDSIDIFILHSVLGHLKNPFKTISKIRSKLKENGIIIIYVISDKYNYKLKDDINKIYYSFSERNLTNIFSTLGFQLEYVKFYKHHWPPKYKFFYNFFGSKIFNLISFIYGSIFKVNRHSHFIFKKKLQKT